MHLRDMAELHKTHPDVYGEFNIGHFTVQKIKRVFSAIPIDQAHEQNNACVKGDGDSVGLTDNPSALRRWMISGPEVARVIGEFENSDQQENGRVNTHHHDQTTSVQTSFAKKVLALWWLLLKSLETHLKRRVRTYLFLIQRKLQTLLY